MTVVDWLLALCQVADHLDDVKAVRLDVGAFHYDVGQTQDMHAHRPDFRLAADNGDEGETESVRASVLGQLEPMSPAMSQPTVINEHARAAGADHGGAGLHHRPRRWQRPARTAQENV